MFCVRTQSKVLNGRRSSPRRPAVPPLGVEDRANYLPKVKVRDDFGYRCATAPGSTEESWPFGKKFPSKNDGLRACVKLGVASKRAKSS